MQWIQTDNRASGHAAPRGRKDAYQCYEVETIKVPCNFHVRSISEVGDTVPHQLDCNGQNQKAEDFVDRAYRTGTKTPHQRAAEDKK